MTDQAPDLVQSSVPTRHQLVGQRLVLQVVGGGQPSAAVRSSYAKLPTSGMYRSPELELAEHTLVRLGLLEIRDGWICPTEAGTVAQGLLEADYLPFILVRTLQFERPLWLAVVALSGADLRLELLPESEASNLASLGIPGDQLDALLLAGVHKVDLARRAEIGLEGELAVVEHCCEILRMHGSANAERGVVHASLISDSLGFDVKSPALDGGRVHLEVKTTTSSGGIVDIFLSRHEAKVAARDPNWRLVVCRLVPGRTEVVGWCRYSHFRSLLPVDQPGGGRWESARLTIDVSELTPGVPLGPGGSEWH